MHAEKIHALREERRLTLAELARRSEVSYAYLKDICNGRQQPSGVVVHKIAVGLDCSIDDFTTPKQPASNAS